MNKALTYFAPEPVALAEGREHAHWFKNAVLCEQILFKKNMKAYIGCGILAVLGVADIAADGTGWESKGIQAALIAVVCYLFRLLIVERREHDAEKAKLYERIIKNGGGNGKDKDEETVTRRARSHE